MKVLVANENKKRTTEFCKCIKLYDEKIYTSIANTCIETLEKYNKLKIDALVLNSYFRDINAPEIVERLSVTTTERMNPNILLVVNSSKEQLAFLDITKIYKIFKTSNDEEIINTLLFMKEQNKHKEFNEDLLYKLLFHIDISVGGVLEEILIEAIKECYIFPHLYDNFDLLLQHLREKYSDMTEEQIRRAMRTVLDGVNSKRAELQNNPIIKKFEPNKGISPKTFIQIVVSYLHTQKSK